jgi:hypothetical protein
MWTIMRLDIIVVESPDVYLRPISKKTRAPVIYRQAWALRKFQRRGKMK